MLVNEISLKIQAANYKELFGKRLSHGLCLDFRKMKKLQARKLKAGDNRKDYEKTDFKED